LHYLSHRLLSTAEVGVAGICVLLAIA